MMVRGPVLMLSHPGTGVGVAVGVKVIVGVKVNVGVRVSVGVSVGVLLGRGVNVGSSGPNVAVFVGVSVGGPAVAVSVAVAVGGEVAVGVLAEPEPDPEGGLSPTSTNPRIVRALVEVNVRELKGMSLTRGVYVPLTVTLTRSLVVNIKSLSSPLVVRSHQAKGVAE